MQILYDIKDSVDNIYDVLNGAGFNELIQRIEKIEGSIYSGSGSRLIIGSAAIAEVLQSTNFSSGSSGWQIYKSGDVEFQDGIFRGTIYAEAGAFTDVVWVGEGSDRIKIDGANKRIGTEDFSENLSGWRIYGDGTAEFNNLIVRGYIKTAVFNVGQTIATAGEQIIVKGAAALKEDFTADGSDGQTIHIKGLSDGTKVDLGAVGDVVRIKDDTNDTWFTIASETDNTSYYSYTLNYESGSTGVTYRAGHTVLNYGGSGDGGILLTASATNAPYMQIFTHSGSPWTTQSEKVRIGNLNGWGDFSTDAYGAVFGDYSGGNYLYYNPSASPQFKLSAGGGAVSLSSVGLTLTQGTSHANSIEWVNVSTLTARIYAYEYASNVYSNFKVGRTGSNGAVMTLTSQGNQATQKSYIELKNNTGDRYADISVKDNSDIGFLRITTGEAYFSVDSNTELSVTASGLRLASGSRVEEFSTDSTMSGNSNAAVPTERAIVSWNEVPFAHITLGSRSTAISSGTVTTIPFVNGDVDTSDGIVPSGGTFKPTIAGYYLVTLNVAFYLTGATADSGSVYCYIYHSSSGTISQAVNEIHTPGTGFMALSTSAIRYFDGTSHTVKGRVYHNSGSGSVYIYESFTNMTINCFRRKV